MSKLEESGCPGMREGCPDKRGVLIKGVKYSVLIKHNVLRCPFAGEFIIMDPNISVM